jgi:hypothetical protein
VKSTFEIVMNAIYPSIEPDRILVELSQNIVWEYVLCSHPQKNVLNLIRE